MSAMASGKEAHHRVHYYISCQLQAVCINGKARTPHRVLARMVGEYKKENTAKQGSR